MSSIAPWSARAPLVSADRERGAYSSRSRRSQPGISSAVDVEADRRAVIGGSDVHPGAIDRIGRNRTHAVGVGARRLVEAHERSAGDRQRPGGREREVIAVDAAVRRFRDQLLGRQTSGLTHVAIVDRARDVQAGVVGDRRVVAGAIEGDRLPDLAAPTWCCRTPSRCCPCPRSRPGSCRSPRRPSSAR